MSEVSSQAMAVSQHPRTDSLANGQAPIGDAAGNPVRVVWTRNAQCEDFAATFTGNRAVKAEADLAASCIRARASLLVARRLTSFDLCNIAVPHGFTPMSTRSIVAAVGTGPHSQLAASVAYLLSLRLGVPARAIYGYPQDDEPHAVETLKTIESGLPHLAVEAVQAPDPATMVSALPAGTLLVVGAPGGSWFQRQFFGPGARIRAKAPNGTIVVRHAPTRIYQVMRTRPAFGPHMRAGDASQLAEGQDVVVAEDGRLVGTIRSDALLAARPTLELADVLDDPVHVSPTELVDDARDLINHRQGSVVPVVDSQGRLLGTVTAEDLTIRPLL